MSTDIPPPVGEDRTVAILSYITIIGFIIAIVMHGSSKTRLGAYHLRQCLGLFIAGVVFSVLGTMIAMIPLLGWLVLLAGWLGLFVLWLLGLIAAINGQLKPMPLLGENCQKWFSGAFA